MKKTIFKIIVVCVCFVIVTGFSWFTLRSVYLNHKTPEPSNQHLDKQYTRVSIACGDNASASTFRSSDGKFISRTVEILNNQNQAIELLKSRLKNANKIILCKNSVSRDNCIYSVAEFNSEKTGESKNFNEKDNKYFSIMKVDRNGLITIKGDDLNLIQEFERSH